MDTSGTGRGVVLPAKRGWRRHSEEFKARVIELARRPNTSVAAVALANGLNANMLRRWVREAEQPNVPRTGAEHAPQALPAFVPLPMPEGSAPPSASTPVPSAVPASIVVEIRRGDATVQASLPLGSASAAWLREVLG